MVSKIYTEHPRQSRFKVLLLAVPTTRTEEKMPTKLSGRWPTDRQNLSEKDMWKLLKQRNITILLRVEDEDNEDKAHLYPLILNHQTDLCNTALNTVRFEPDEVKNLSVRFAYPAVIPIGDRHANDFDVTVEDIFGNISENTFKPGTCIEVQDRFVKIDTDPDLGRVWRPIIIVYDKSD